MEGSFVSALLLQNHLPSPVFCFAEASVKKVATKVCACLNETGGWVVVGVDENHVRTGLAVVDFDKQVQQEITNHISPLPLVYVQTEEYDGEPVLLVTIPKGSLAPYTYRGRYYVLSEKGEDIPSSDHLSLLLRDTNGSRSDWERLNNLYAGEEDLDAEKMAEIYEIGLSMGRLTENSNGLRGLLTELQLLKTTEVTNGAVALFARDTRNLLPQCRLRIQLMLSGKEADRYDDLFFVEGNVFDVLKKTVDYFKERLPRVAYFFSDKTERYNDFEYPIEVLDEAISNALIHRDYTDISDEVTVFIYADKLEITNSGVLPEKLVSGKSRVLPHGSVLRNPLMAEVFYVAGAMEKTGRGMLLISNTMRKAGRKLPEWTSANGKTTLRIYSKKEAFVVNDRIKIFLTGKKKGDVFSKSDYTEAFDPKPSKGTVQNDLLLMVKAGLTEKIGDGPSTKYRIS